nr:MAG TPA_asm: hypothetical protein [Caudoviricetes sp.]
MICRPNSDLHHFPHPNPSAFLLCRGVLSTNQLDYLCLFFIKSP